MKVLVADDSRVMRLIVIRALRRAGFSGLTFLEAADGVEALDLIRAQRPDLVLSDWNMPAATGLQVLQQLRAAGDQVTFGFVTSERSVEMRQRAYAAGAQFVIGKPFDADVVLDVLGPVLSAASSTEAPVPQTISRGRTPLPPNRAVRDMFETLLGRDINVMPGEPFHVSGLDPAHVAVYVDDAMRMKAAAVMDLALAVRCGSALELISRTVANDVLRVGVLPPNVRANVDEVCNVISTLFNRPGTPHLRLYATHAPGERLPTDANAFVHTLGNRTDLLVDIDRYGAGRLALVVEG